MLQTLSNGLTRPNFGSPFGTPLEGIGLNLAAFEGFGTVEEVSTAFGVEAACAKEEWSGGGGGGRSGPSKRFLWAGLPTATSGASWVPLGGWAGSGEGTDGSRGGGGGGSGDGGGGGGGRGAAALPVPTIPYGPLSLSPCL
eukprot:s1541_g6.t1